jgi:surfactin synthase thioesterase subunit
VSAFPHRRPQHRPRLRLFCFPFAGGGASLYRGWEDPSHEIEFCAYEPAGRETRFREALAPDMAAMAGAAVEAVSSLLDAPFAIFGHSFGGNVALEVSRELRRRGREPRVLFVSGCCGPGRARRVEPIHDHDDAQLTAALAGLGGTPPEVFEHRELLDLLLPVLRADLKISDAYRANAEPHLECPVVAMGGVDDQHVQPDDLRAWRSITAGPFRLELFAGDHFYLRDPQLGMPARVAALARAILGRDEWLTPT